MTLPEEFISYTKKLFGEELWKQYITAFDGEVPVSIRLNPWKTDGAEQLAVSDKVESRVPWCRNAFYLSERPNFTLDPMLHAGAYYVQEASSMFLDEVIRQHVDITEGTALDLCAAPGGKSTLLRAALPSDVTLYCNEPDRKRANILLENIQKQGHPNVVVTSRLARDYADARMLFDFILCDVPCSGEGMFRKDSGAISEWSLRNVMHCQELQRSIIKDIWPCLKPGAIMVYSTCTFNTHEDEENVRWITEELGAELLPVATHEEWHITGSLLSGWDKPVYRFIPGTTRGEGLFMAVLRKTNTTQCTGKLRTDKLDNLRAPRQTGKVKEQSHHSHKKEKEQAPAHADALLINLDKDRYPMTELSREDALRYLHREAVTLPDSVPRGFVIVTYGGLPLGFVKNIGTRANNLYPAEWRIRNL